EKVGPWGTIEAARIPLANTDGLFPDQPDRLRKPKWFFENVSEPRLKGFLNSCELRPAQKRILMDKPLWNIRSNGCVMSAPTMLIWTLSSNRREQIYSVLAKSSANYPQCFPFRFPAGTFERLLQRRGLSAQNVERLVRLTYIDAGNECFTDLQTAQ